MCPIRYYDILKDSANPFNLRIKMVQFAFQNGVSPAAIKFETTRKTVRKWKKLYEKSGTAGLHNKSKAPRTIHHKTPKHIEDAILQHRNKLPSWGPVRLKDDFALPVSTGAIYRILKQHGKINKYRRKYQRKSDIRKLKAAKMRLRAFEKIQIDVKDLIDIPNYYKFKQSYNLPRYQYTAKDVKTGFLYIAHARKNDCINAANFLALLAEHLQYHHIDLRKVTVQTDNGAEFIGNWKQRKPSLFTHLAERVFKMRHYRIPPRRCTFNSDVESSHLRIEKDFYDLEIFPGKDALAINSFTYILYQNLLKKNKSKFNKTSYEIVLEEHPKMKTTICAFNPVILDDKGLYYSKYVSSFSCGKTGYHLPTHARV